MIFCLGVFQFSSVQLLSRVQLCFRPVFFSWSSPTPFLSSPLSFLLPDQFPLISLSFREGWKNEKLFTALILSAGTCRGLSPSGQDDYKVTSDRKQLLLRDHWILYWTVTNVEIRAIHSEWWSAWKGTFSQNCEIEFISLLLGELAPSSCIRCHFRKILMVQKTEKPWIRSYTSPVPWTWGPNFIIIYV